MAGFNQWLDRTWGGGGPNHDQSPQLVESLADGVVGLGRLTVQGHCLSGHSHYPPSQPLAQLLTQDKRERESARIWLRCPNNAAICSLCPAPLLWAQWFSGKSIWLGYRRSWVLYPSWSWYFSVDLISLSFGITNYTRPFLTTPIPTPDPSPQHRFQHQNLPHNSDSNTRPFLTTPQSVSNCTSLECTQLHSWTKNRPLTDRKHLPWSLSCWLGVYPLPLPSCDGVHHG